MIRLLLSPITITCALAACLHVFVYYAGYTFTPGTLADPDGYMRLLRVEHLLDTGQWYNQNIELANAPYGHSLPWGRLLDLVILLIALPFLIFQDAKEAIFSAGVWVSPLLLIPCGMALVWAQRKYRLSNDFCLAAVALYLMQPALVNYYVAARPDHHALLITMFLIQLILVFGCLREGSRLRDFVMAGVVMGASCWISIEPLAMWVATTCVFAVMWLREPERIRQVLVYHAATVVATMLIILLETPALLWSEPAVDRLSGYYLILFLATLLGWYGIGFTANKVTLHSLVQRVGLGMLGGALAIGVVCYFAAPITKGPMGALPPDILELWLPRLDEFQPVGSSLGEAVAGVLTWVPVVVLALPFVIWQIAKRIQLGDGISIRIHEYAWIIFAVIFTGLIFYQKRWSSYADIIWLIPAALLIAKVLKQISDKPGWVILRVPCLFILLVIPFLPKGGMSFVAQPPETAPIPDQIHYNEAELVAWAGCLPETSTLLTPFNVSPALMYFTGHRTVGGNYHTNPDGIIDSYTFWMTSDVERAMAILRLRHVDYVIIESSIFEAGFSLDEMDQDEMFIRMIEGRTPAFLTFDQVCGGYQIYKVTGIHN